MRASENLKCLTNKRNEFDEKSQATTRQQRTYRIENNNEDNNKEKEKEKKKPSPEKKKPSP